MSFDYDLKSNLVAMISNHSQSQSKLQLDKETGLILPSYKETGLILPSDKETGLILPSDKETGLILPSETIKTIKKDAAHSYNEFTSG